MSKFNGICVLQSKPDPVASQRSTDTAVREVRHQTRPRRSLYLVRPRSDPRGHGSLYVHGDKPSRQRLVPLGAVCRRCEHSRQQHLPTGRGAQPHDEVRTFKGAFQITVTTFIYHAVLTIHALFREIDLWSSHPSYQCSGPL